MITAVLMPQMGLEVTEGTVVEVLVEVGASVVKDDTVMVLSTDKADADVVASSAGVVRAIDAAVGDTVEVGAALLWLSDTADEPFDRASADGSAPVDAPAEAAPDAGADVPPAELVVPDGTNGTPRLRAAPVARRAAAARGIPLESLVGTGPRGRITLRDVEAAPAPAAPAPVVPAPAAPAPAAAAPAPRTEPRPPATLTEGLEPLSPNRRAIARRMTMSQREIPQYQLVREIDFTHVLAQKTAAAAVAAAAVGDVSRPGVNDLLVQAIAEMLVRHPDLAATFVDEEGSVPSLRRPASIDVGLAVAGERGLVVPVLRRAHERSLRELAADRIRLVKEAREGTLSLADMTGGTVSLSNLGSFGIDRFTAMVNPGESAIVAVGRVVDRVVPRGRGTAVVPTLTLTISFDHRVVDGATGAGALSELAELLEGAMPWRI